MPRKPKGSYLRVTPDYFVDDLSCGGWFDNQNPNPQYGEIGLFNNDGGGRKLYLYAMTITASDADVAYMVVRGAATGSNVASGSNIDPSKGGGVGQVFFRRFGAAAAPFVVIPPPANTVQIITIGIDSTNAPGTYPLAIIPVGMQLSIISSVQTQEYAVGFWYVPL